MYITHVSAKNFKGRSFDYDLSKASIIGGRNFVGKSSIIEAVRLALLGHLPELGATDKATFQLSSGPYMSVCIQFSDGAKIERRWSSKGASVKKEVSGEVPESAADSLGVLLNIQEYFGMSEAKRVNYIFGAVRLGEEHTPQGLIDKLKGSSGHEATKTKLVDALVETLAEDTTLQVFYDLAAEQVKQMKSEEDAYLKRLTASLQHSAQLAAEQDVVAYDIDAITARISAVNEEESKLNTEFGRRKQQLETRRRNATLLATARQDVEKFKGLDETEVNRLKAERDKLTHEVTELEAERNELQKKSQAASKEYAIANKAFRDASSDVDHANNQIEDFDKLECCPTCKATASGWKETVLSGLRATLAVAEKQFNVAKSVKDELADAEQQISDKLNVAEKKFVHERARLKSLTLEVQQASENFVRLCNAEANIANYGNDDLSLEEGDKAIADITDQISGLRAERKKLQADLDAANAIKDREKGIAKTTADKEETELAIAFLKSAASVIAESKERVVNEAIATVLTGANYFISGILPFGELAYENNEFGYRSSASNWVGCKTLSGTEQLVTYMGISLALAAQSDFKIAVMDELARLDPISRNAFCDKVSEGISEGRLDQFIGIMPSASDGEVKQFAAAHSFDFISVK